MSENSLRDAIAIVGMACRLPGADDLTQYWDLVRTGSSAIAPLPADRLNRELYFHPERGQLCKTYSDLGGLVRARPFDRGRCPIPEETIEQVDVAHLTLLEVAAEACRDSGYDPFQLPFRNVGVFVGHTGGSPVVSDLLYSTVVEEGATALDGIEQLRQLGLDPRAFRDQLVQEIRRRYPGRKPKQKLRLGAAVASELISESFGLQGPYGVVDAACASSLQALALGVRSLLLGRLDAAIVGSASYCKSDSLVLFSAAQSVSSKGSCPFSREADGLISAEGYVVFLLKTVERALRDGDRIHAVISGLGVSSDGRGKSLWAPRTEGQILAVERAYAGNLDANRLQYIEAHATSTQVGDATELQALSQSLSNMLKDPTRKIPIGSVKGNVGHTLETAGVAGLLKTVLAINKQTIPPAMRFRELNTEIDWDHSPFYVPFEPQAWPDFPDGHPRRAAVNSFGIGGLNVHVVVDEFQPVAPANRSTVNVPANVPTTIAKNEPIAIIGMGCVFPGAHTVDAFWDLLIEGRDPKILAPPQRIPGEIAFVPGEPQSWRTYNLLGGFVEGWEYDWRRHKIPPKQIAQANPLQFMLLDAADQAFQNAQIDIKTLRGERVSAIVGTIFGGDFSDHLQMGLRLPEFRASLRNALTRRQTPADKIAAIEIEFQKRLLAQMPALLDETGSFTSSTLASRITKSFNLMGGALAVDAGNCSAALVIQAAVDQLRLGHVDMVVCASGQRSMDLWTYEGLSLANCLPKETPHTSLDKDGQGVLPGEGCGVILLKRLSDAQRDGNPIQGVIRGISVYADKDLPTAIAKASAQALSQACVPASAVMAIETNGVRDENNHAIELEGIVKSYANVDRVEALAVGDITSQIGHTGGASAMAGLLKSTLASKAGMLPSTLHLQQPEESLAQASQVKVAGAPLPLATVSGTPYRAAAVSSIHNRMAYQIIVDNGAPLPAFSVPSVAAATPLAVSHEVARTRIVRFSASSAAELRERLLNHAAEAWSKNEGVGIAAPARCTILASSPEELSQKAALAASFIAKERSDQAADHGIFFATERSTPAQAAFLFPGQGSQYANMLRAWCDSDAAARADVAQVDAMMQRYRFPTFSELAWSATSPLGTDVWTTQAAMLLADWLVYRATERLGVQPSFIAGHSYGEFPALVAAGVWSLEDALLGTRARCDAVIASQATPTMMLSLAAGRNVIEGLLQTSNRQVWLCAENGPEQCVVGGAISDVQAFAELCSQQRIRSKALPVPCAFHTPLLAATRAPLMAALRERTFRAPRVRFASTTYPCFVHEPNDLRASLIEQMTHPVEFVATVRRLLEAGANTFIEIGPSQILSQLATRIVPSDGACRVLALDASKKGQHSPALQLQAACEAWGIGLGQPKSTTVPAAKAASPSDAPVRIIDATLRRRQRLRARASQQSVSSVGAVALASASPITNVSDLTKPTTAHVTHTHEDAQPDSIAPSARAPWCERTARLIADVMSLHGLPIATELDASVCWLRFVQNADAFVEDLAECFSLDEVQYAQLRSTSTLGELVAILHDCPGKTGWLELRQRQNTTVGSSSSSAADLQQILVDFVVDQTGYPAEIVELDADLEADLGIDSIKKAQLFGELGERFRLSADPNMSLDDFPTLGHVLKYLQKHVSSDAHSTSLPATRNHVASTNDAVERMAVVESAVAMLIAPSEEATTQPGSATDIEAFLVEFVVEQTGYPPEIVDLDADLEADLGIDSIKKAQLFGEIGNRFQLSADPDLSLDDFPTLRHVLKYLLQTCCSEQRPAEAPLGSETTHSINHARASENAANIAPANSPQQHDVPAPQIAADELQDFLVNFVVEQTGYPSEIVEMDADLEADLGIDSIKKAQLFGEIGNHFRLSADPNLSLDDFPTLRHVHQYLTSQVGATEIAPTSAAASAAPTLASDASPASPAYDRGFVHGRRHRDTIRVALRQHAASSPPSVSTAWTSELTVAEYDELVGIATGADVLLQSLIAWQSALGTTSQPLTSRTESVEIDGRRGLVMMGWALTQAALCSESSADYVAVRIPGQLGAIAGLSAAGIALTLDTTAFNAPTEALPASILLLRALQNAPGLTAGAKLDARLRATVANDPSLEASQCKAGTLNALQKQLEHASGPAWISARTSLLGGLPTYQAFQWLVVGPDAWVRWHDDGPRQNGSTRWERLELPFALARHETATKTKPHSPVQFPPGNRITQRYIPRLVPAANAASLPSTARVTEIILIGDAPYAARLATELATNGLTVRRLSQHLATPAFESQLQALIAELPQASLILALDQPIDLPGNQAAWESASQELLLNTFRACQLWLAAPRTDHPPRILLGIAALGGGLGLGQEALSPWSGALTGLLKGIRNEYPDVVVRVVDVADPLVTSTLGQSLVAELFSTDRETEIALRSTGRWCIRYDRSPATPRDTELPQPHEQWVVTGGARGITGYVAKALSERYGVKLHLLGSTAISPVDPSWLTANAAELKQIRSRIMIEAKSSGSDPLVAWSRVEKTIEIQQHLARLQAAGVDAHYHVCDLTNWQSLATVLAKIRAQGPIRGILHGAGFETAAKLEKKKLPLVERTLHTKAGGAAALIALTANDPIGWFIAFGSTSGRLGGLGQADYSMANDMLAKQMDWLRQQRPACRATVFHWHAWGEIGMAARPESRFALESFGLRFMPPAEGAAYLLAEIEAGLPEPEVMITEELLCPANLVIDSAQLQAASDATTADLPIAAETSKSAPAASNWAAYLINFVVEQTGYPAEIVDLDADLEADLGIDSIKKAQLFGEIGEQFQLRADDSLSLDDFPTLRHVLQYLEANLGQNSSAATTTETAVHAIAVSPATTPLFTECLPLSNQTYVVKGQLDPTTDVFLTDHCMLGRPVLPGVTGCELLAQAVAIRASRGRYVHLRNVEVAASLRFPTDDSRYIEVAVEPSEIGHRAVVRSLLNDRRNGEQDPRREHVTGDVAFPETFPLPMPVLEEPPFAFNPMVYPDDAAMYHGYSLRMLDGLIFQNGGGWGRLKPSPMDGLAGTRSKSGWILPMAPLDGCIVGCAVFSWLMLGRRVEIPQGFGELWLLHEPRPHEKLQMQFKFLRSDERNSWYDFDLFTIEGKALAVCRDLRLVKFGKDELP